MSTPITIQTVADALTSRLLHGEANVEKELSSGYEDARWNGRAIITINLTPAFQALLSAGDDLFLEDNKTMEAIEAASGGALVNDDGGYAGTFGLHEYGVYLLDPATLDQALAAIMASPEVSAQERDAEAKLLAIS